MLRESEPIERVELAPRIVVAPELRECRRENGTLVLDPARRIREECAEQLRDLCVPALLEPRIPIAASAIAAPSTNVVPAKFA